jgi:hypothetical protein
VSTDIVFVGPTMPAAEAAALLPAAQIRPPVCHGDLLRLEAGPGDRILIIDGLFLQAASIRHREILYLLQRGVTVAGSSSMGALRAAELWPFGMRGFGEVFRLYRDGVIDGDDEVAIVHGTAEDGHRSYSDPLVSIRIALRDATAAGVIGGQEAQLMLDLATAMPFRSRSFRALDRVARGHVPSGTADAFAAWTSAHDTDAKAADARLMLTAAAAADPALRPAGADDQPIRNVHTWLFDRWEHKFRGRDAGGEWVADSDSAMAIRLTHPGFREAHRRHVLAKLTRIAPDHPALSEHAAETARAKGLSVPGPGLADSWLTEPDLAKPDDEVLATLLVRTVGTRSAESRWDMPPDMRTPAMLAWGREFVAAARQCNERLLAPAGGAPRRRFRPEAIDRAIAKLWGCDVGDLQAEAWDRGFADLAALRRVAEPFVAHLKVFGVPDPITAAG